MTESKGEDDEKKSCYVEQALADSEEDIHVEAIEDPSDTEESESTSIVALRLASAFRSVASAFFTVLSAAAVTGIVFVFVLKPSTAKIDVPSGDLKAASGLWMADPDDEDDTPGTPAGHVATLGQHDRSSWPWANVSDYSEDSDDSDSKLASSNMTIIEELGGIPPNFTLPNCNDTQNLDDVV
ncbi:hypothetical protein MRX96_009857 [Rhipicephalus microplus]